VFQKQDFILLVRWGYRGGRKMQNQTRSLHGLSAVAYPSDKGPTNLGPLHLTKNVIDRDADAPSRNGLFSNE
jgi:hypothetical protein